MENITYHHSVYVLPDSHRHSSMPLPLAEKSITKIPWNAFSSIWTFRYQEIDSYVLQAVVLK